ncbi:hypothetical protein TNCV_1693001 [Trichonephila clavipes]|nr:hypothetical protein TNCV_1693001 [Trichonephila clavipes]
MLFKFPLTKGHPRQSRKKKRRRYSKVNRRFPFSPTPQQVSNIPCSFRSSSFSSAVTSPQSPSIQGSSEVRDFSLFECGLPADFGIACDKLK